MTVAEPPGRWSGLPACERPGSFRYWWGALWLQKWVEGLCRRQHALDLSTRILEGQRGADAANGFRERDQESNRGGIDKAEGGEVYNDFPDYV